MRWAFVICGLCVPAQADTVVATRTIRAQEIVTAAHVRLDATSVPGAYEAVEDVLGQEARIAIYPGRPILQGTLTAPALVQHNQLVELVFDKKGLRISTEGRALGRGGVGERIRVMNLSSRTVLFGTVQPDATISVTP